tara:strand:- start:739 stop:1068 length:330 start_codon:yes stop_codon:yes gene_type:complete
MSDTYNVMHIFDVPNDEGEFFEVVEYDEKPDLETMQSWTKSGMIEVITVMHEGKECHAIIDENGKFDDTNVINQMASTKWYTWLIDTGRTAFGDMIVGKCSVLTNYELE